jgi:hypothetical protein
MSEFKPKQDDHRAGEASSSHKTGDSPKRHGDKLQHAVDEASKPAQPLLKTIPHLTENSLKDIHGVVRRLASEHGTEEDWQDALAELERVMTEKDIEFEGVTW